MRTPIIQTLKCACLILVMSTAGLQAQAIKNTEIKETQTTFSELTAAQKKAYDEKGKPFDLTGEEYYRYEEIMKGPRGLRSPNVDPVMVLGAHARTPDERKRFAELAVQHEHELMEGILTFQREYTSAQKRLYGHLPLLNSDVMTGIKSPEPLKGLKGDLRLGDRVLYFSRLTCEECQTQINNLIQRIRSLQGVGLDLYFIDSGKDDEKIRDWARTHDIPSELVRRKVITLNHDLGTLLQLDPNRGTPTALVRRGGLVFGFDEALN